jgi:hypothetical protein
MFVSQQAVAKMQCGSKMKCHKEKQQPCRNEKCENNGCNPFMACAYGNFFLINKNSFAFNLPQMKKSKMVTINDNRLSNKLSDCWHPPQFV